jgi:diacylglycerol kinase
LLSTGIETVVDRVGSDWHALSKKAKAVRDFMADTRILAVVALTM